MQRISVTRRVSHIFLLLAPFLPVLDYAYRPGGLKGYAVAGAVQAVLMGAAAWILGGEASGSSAPERRAGLAPGVFLIAAWAAVSLALKMGAPPRGQAWLATQVDQEFRYVALFVGGILAFGAFAILRARLREAGDRLLSILGLAAVTVSLVMFVLAVQAVPAFVTHSAKQEAIFGSPPDWQPPVRSLLNSAFLVFAVLTYLTTALFAMALRSAKWLGTVGCALFVGLSLAAATLAVIAVTVPFGPRSAGQGIFVVLVPAVPFILPYLLGVHLVRRAGDPVA